MRKRGKTSKVDDKTGLLEKEHQVGSLAEAAREWDALFYFVQKHYSKLENNSTPSLHTFLIKGGDVVFTDKVKHVTLQKNPETSMLEIITPPVLSDQEEPRRIFLLNEFGELIIKSQKQSWLQLRAMLFTITDEEGRKALIEEFDHYMASLKLKQGDSEG